MTEVIYNSQTFIFWLSGLHAAVLNYEEDVAAYTIMAATDPRAANRVIILRPSGNILSEMDLISLWEKKTGRTVQRIYVPEEEIVKLSESKQFIITILFRKIIYVYLQV